MTDGLKDAHREAVIAVIASNSRVERAVLFGSRATGTNTVSSDVDIALFGDRLTLTDQARLAAALDEIPMAQTVDLLLYDSLHDRTLREHIWRQGIEWYARPTGHRDRSTLPRAGRGDSGRSSLCLDDLAVIVMGQSPSGETVSMREGVGLLNGPTEFGPHHPHPVQFTTDPRRYAQPGDLLFCVRGSTTGRMNWADRRYAIGRGVAAIRHRHDLGLQSFVRAVIEFELPELLAHATGSTFPNVSASQLAQIPCPSFTQDEQRAIAHILGTLDDKIEVNRRMNATLEAMARALFRSWFVDFDPVRAKMENRDTGLPKEIAHLFPDRLVNSELGAIPDGWDVSEIGAEVDAVGGGTPSTKEPAYWSGGRHCWATPKDLSKLSSPALLGTDRKITDAGVRKISSGLLPRGTVLLSSRAPIGYLAITEVPTAVNQGFIAMICRKRLSALYVLSWCHENLERIKDISGGSTFAEISKKTFRPLPVAVPPKRLLGMHDETSRSLHDRIVSNTRESALLASLRDALLPRLVSGELRVTGLERASGSVDNPAPVERHGI